MYAESDYKNLLLLRALLHARLLYTANKLYRFEATPAGRNSLRWFGMSSLDAAWSEATNLHRRYEAVCEAMRAFEEAEDSPASTPQVGDLLFPEFPNAGGVFIGAARMMHRASQFMLPPVALVAAIVFLIRFLPVGGA